MPDMMPIVGRMNGIESPNKADRPRVVLDVTIE